MQAYSPHSGQGSISSSFSNCSFARMNGPDVKSTKSEATANVVRLLDSTIKLVGVGKIVAQDSGSSVDEEELLRILEPELDDESI